MATLGVTFGGVFLATRGGGEKTKERGPLINASTKEEETFIQYVMPAVGRDSVMGNPWKEVA